MGRRRKGRSVNGILVLDKPLLRSSNAALQMAKRLFFASKAGHTGSLDPLATGVLPICFGEATKFSQYLLDSDKAYRSTFTLGQVTSSSDAEGEMLESCDASAITEARFGEAMDAFRGEIEQVPSMFSALKHNGQPLYKLARKGVEVERKRRRVNIFEFSLEGFRPGEHPQVDVYIHSSKGTYVRSIAEDIGAALGVGAHVSALHRVKAGPFGEVDMLSLEALQKLTSGADEGDYSALDALLKPVEFPLAHFPSQQVDEEAAMYLRQGQPVWVPGAPSESLFKLLDTQGGFIGLGEASDDGRVVPRRLLATN